MKYLFLVSLLASCGQKDKYREDYGIVTDTNLNVFSQHMGGYGRAQCLLCHNAQLNVHRRGANGLNADQMAAAARTGGLSEYCKNCHTGNGL